MRLWHQSFTVLGDLPGYEDAMRAHLAKTLRPDTEVVFHGQAPGTYPGDYPGDGKPKPVRFPDPARAAIDSGSFRVLGLPRVIELKLASGMSAPHRARDLVDIQELIRAAQLPLALADELDPSVQGKYRELWQIVANAPVDDY